LVKQSKNLVGVEFVCGSYLDLIIPENSLIYADPPYRLTTKYNANKGGFDHEQFWNWCREKSQADHLVFISEYAAPEDFECVKEIEHKTILDKNSQYKRVEKLFILRKL